MEETRFFELDAKIDSLRTRLIGDAAQAFSELGEKLDIGWLYHDNALEGIVLTYAEIKEALDRKIISDVSLVSIYEEIRNHKATIDVVRDAARAQAPIRRKRGLITVDFVKQLHEMLTPEDKAKGNPYRKDNPLHRSYFHEISPPDKIPLRMRKLCEWLDEEDTEALHPVSRAAGAHLRLMAIYPWAKNSGKVGRLLMNLLLLRDGYPPAVIHSIERQRYYESLRSDNGALAGLVLESLHIYADTALRFLDELDTVRRARQTQARAAS